ncbi:MAG: hypothetical protein ACXWZR_16365 [Mycobacterium sp.]
MPVVMSAVAGSEEPMRGAHPHTVLVVIDPTCQRPPHVADVARCLPAGAALIAVVLWTPPALTLNVRLLLWQARHRALSTEDLIDRIRQDVNAARPYGRDVAVSGHSYRYRRSPAARHRRVADAVADLCRIHQPELVVLPDGALTDARAREHVRAQVPEDVAITLAKPVNPHAAISPAAGDGRRRAEIRHMPAACRLIATAALTIVAVVAAMNLTALAASISPLLGLAALPITLTAALIALDMTCQRLAPRAARACHRHCRAIVTRLRSDR